MSNKSGTKKRKSINKRNESTKKSSVRFASPQLSPQQPKSRGSRSKTLRSDENEWLDDNAEDIASLPPISLQRPNSKTRSHTIGHTGDTPTQDRNKETELKVFAKPATRSKSAKSVHTVEYHAPTDYKKKYDALKMQNNELNRKMRDYEWKINNLQRELKKSNKGDAHEDASSSHYQRTIKHKEKEIANLRQRMKLAINDYEKVYGYYKKQLELFKKRQQKWLNEQRANERDVTKYVFADDIKRVKVRKKGLRIYFSDGEDVVFEAIEVIGSSTSDRDYNDDDQYRKLVKKVREEAAVATVDLIETLDEDDMIILCLNELNARIRDFKHRGDDGYVSKMQQRFDKLPLYHIDDLFLKQLKANNANWLKLFRKSVNGKKSVKGGLGAAFFSAQHEMKSGKQPTICVQNNVILNNINQHKKATNVRYSQHLQKKVNSKLLQQSKMDKESANVESDEDLSRLSAVSVGNGWFTAQIEMTQYNQQPSVCIKNNIRLQHIQKKKSKYKLKKKKVRGKTLQKRLNDKIMRMSHGKSRGRGHSKNIAMDKGDSSEEDENGNDIYNLNKNVNKSVKTKKKEISNLMSGWFAAQVSIAQDKQPTICVQNNVFLNNLNKEKKLNDLSAAKLQKKLNENTSSGLSKNALDLSDDEDNSDGSNASNGDGSHAYMWYYADDKRRKFINNVAGGMSAEKAALLLEIGVYLNRLLPTSIDYPLIKHYLPMFNNVCDIMAALFDGVIIAVLINFLDDDLIDLRAINVATATGSCSTGYPVSREQVIENLFVIKMCISSLDLHQFPDFEIADDADNAEPDAFCWFNERSFVDILLLIVMHQFSGLLNKKINVLRYPELFRLCQNREDKKCAQKTSCKEWLHRWIVFIQNPKMMSDGRFLSIDLGSYNSPVASGNISWDTIRVLPQAQAQAQEEEKETEKEKEENKFIYVYNWNCDRRDFSSDIASIHCALSVSGVDEIDTIARSNDIFVLNNYLMQLIYLCDLFVFASNIEELSHSESQIIHDYIDRAPHIDLQIIAWINSFHILDGDGNYQYVDNLTDNISDGIILLKLLHALKPGCVDWKSGSIRLTAAVRHKFDKLTNCNIVKQICDESFRDIFHLVGMGGNDIVDGNGKYIRSLLLQIQRHHATKLMATILFKKRAVSDDELLKWINNRLAVYQQMVAAMNKMNRNRNENENEIIKKEIFMIKSFEDKEALADAINYCNVISSINPKWINYQFIHNEIACKREKYKKIQNAKYLITTLRRLGTDSIFITPKQFVQCQTTATISIATAIMTIAAKYHQYDQLALFAKNLKQIKAKMQKK